ncbi:MAG: UMP kinase [Patescibacteria group bacterium]|nr:UMP kinase [Patescibacteria group bacterium]
MKHSFGKTVVIALGGSIIYPKEIDVRFLGQFKSFIESFTKKGMRFVLVVGGGKVSRIYQAAAAKVAPLTDDDKDWLGIHATRSNAHLVRTVFRKVADPVIVDSRNKIKKLKHPVTVASGWRPGWSTDYVAMAIAHKLGVREVVIAGKPNAVYEKNPDRHVKMGRISCLRWGSYRALIPKEWKPGLHAPVDPVAARFAERNGIVAVIVGGRRLKNLERSLRGENFQGTIIE